MKRITALLLALLLCAALAACSSSQTQPTVATEAPAAETEQQKFTLAPKIEQIEPEWSPIDCELYLADENGDEYAAADEFECFALAGSSDEDGALLFKPTEELLTRIGLDDTFHTAWHLYIEGEEIGEMTLEEDQFTLSGMPFSDLCELATLIRGV